MTHPHEDEIETLLTAIAEQDSGGSATRQAFLWCIDSRRMWRERALDAEERANRMAVVLSTPDGPDELSLARAQDRIRMADDLTAGDTVG